MAPADALLDELVRVSADLDRLIADRQAGPSTHTRRVEQIDQVEQLAARLRAAVRGPGRQDKPANAGTARGVNPPRYVSPCGRRAGW